MSLSGRVDAPSGHHLCILQVMARAGGPERTSVGAQENYISGFSGTHLLAGDLARGKPNTFSSRKGLYPLMVLTYSMSRRLLSNAGQYLTIT